MRVVRLQMERYGHVSGEALELPADRGLHVVLGANEAGKSTALEALSDALFGFGKHSRKYRHPDDPRIAVTLQTADGDEATFVRRNTRKDNLLDDRGTAVSEQALARFLGGISRTRFREVFGLDGERLREGGRTILSEHGEAGAAVLQARTGLRGLRDAVDRLDNDAKALFGDGRGARKISLASTRVLQNRQLISDRSLSGAEYVKATKEEASLTAQLDAMREETAGLRGEQARLERTRRTAPIRSVLAKAAQDLQALGPLPDLPPDAGARRTEALFARDQAGRDLDQSQARGAAVTDAMARLNPDAAVLAEAPAILALAADANRIAEVRRDHLKVAGQAAERLRILDEAAARLGVAERGADLRRRVPDAAIRAAAGRLLKQRAEQSGAYAVAAAVAAKAAIEARQAADGLAAALPAPNADLLRHAVDAANLEGGLDAALAEAAAHRATADLDAEQALAGLAGWSGGVDRLRASPVPLEAEAARLGRALEEAAAGVDLAVTARAALDDALEECRAAMAGIERAGPLPTADAIAAARHRRNEALRLLRRHFVDGGAPPSADEWPGEAVPAAAALPQVLDRLILEADALADRRLVEAIRVGKWEEHLDQQARLLALQPVRAEAVASAIAVQTAAQEAWRAAWQPAGVEPLDPAAMREWVRDRDAVLKAARANDDAVRKHDDVAARHARLLTRLQAVVPDACGTDIAASRQAAIRALHLIDETAARRLAAEGRAAQAAEEHAAALATLTGLDNDAEAWRLAWAPVALRLGLTPAADPADATAALEIWAALQNTLREWTALGCRLQEMTGALQDDATAAAALADRLGEPMTPSLVADLATRLNAAQIAHAERARLQKEHAALVDAQAAATRTASDATGVLETLRRQAGAVDDAELAAAIVCASDHAALLALIKERKAELHKTNDGKTEAELASEASTLDVDAIPGRLADIAARLTEIEAGRVDVAERRADLRATLARMQAGQDVAGPAEAVQDALAEIEDAAGAYVRLRLAHALLRGGIEGFRRAQQAPLLAKASGLFATLTRDRYIRLELDETEKGETLIVAVRADASTCPADMLSEGSRDQLFLALRLASIALDAESAEPLPFIADDLLVNFDDDRAAAALRLLAQFGETTQVILFTHHDHLARLADPAWASLHRLPRELAAA